MKIIKDGEGDHIYVYEDEKGKLGINIFRLKRKNPLINLEGYSKIIIDPYLHPKGTVESICVFEKEMTYTDIGGNLRHKGKTPIYKIQTINASIHADSEVCVEERALKGNHRRFIIMVKE